MLYRSLLHKSVQSNICQTHNMGTLSVANRPVFDQTIQFSSRLSAVRMVVKTGRKMSGFPWGSNLLKILHSLGWRKSGQMRMG